MNPKTTNQPYLKSLLGGVMTAVLALVALCNAVNASADSPPVVTLTASYHGTWSAYFLRADLDYSLCAAITEEEPLENCLSTTANTDNNTIVNPWTQTSIINDEEDWLKESSSDPDCTSVANCLPGPYAVSLSMGCPNGGAPNPTIYGDEGAVVRGWCLILGEAPPPATAPTCANGLPPSGGQNDCASPGELNTGDPDPCGCVGDPINAGSGNMYLTATDYKSGGQFPLEFTRSYNSVTANQGPSPDGADQNMGMGWTTNVTGPHLYINTIQQYVTCQDTSTTPATDYICPASSSPALVTVWRPDGRQSVFSGLVTSQATGVSGTLALEPGAMGQLSYGPLPAPLGGTGYAYLRNDGYTEFYDDFGRLLLLQNPHGSQQVYTYNASGQLVRIAATSELYYVGGGATAPASITLTYDSNNRLSTMTNPGGQPNTGGPPGTYIYSYDAVGNLAQVEYPDNTTVQYLYEDSSYPHALTGVIDGNGNRYATWGYDASGRAITSQNGNGASVANATSVTYNSDGSADVIEPNGLARHLTFTTVNGAAAFSSATAPCTMCTDKSETILYQDVNGNPYASGILYKTVTDFDGNITKYVIDPQGRELSRTEAYGTQAQREFVTAWNAVVGLPEQETIYNSSNQPVYQTVYCYNYNSTCADSSGVGTVWTVQKIDPVTNNSRTKTYTYNPPYPQQQQMGAGLLSKVRDSNANTIIDISYVIEAQEYLQIDGQQWYAYFDPNLELTEIRLQSTTSKGLSEAFTYDSRQRLIRAYVPDTQYRGQMVSFDNAGNAVKLTFPAGGYYQFGFDTAHRLNSVSDSDGGGVSYTLDSLGNRTDERILNSGGHLKFEFKRTYDAYNHLLNTTDGMGAVTKYQNDLLGNRTQVTDPNGNITSLAYDSLNRMVQSTNPNNGVTKYTLDALNHVLDVVTPRGLDTHYSYDAFGDVLSVNSPDTGVTTYGYDSNGNMTSKADSNGTANYVYDLMSRVTNINYPDSSKDVTYIYDQIQPSTACPITRAQTQYVGRLLCMIDQSGATRYSYDVGGSGDLVSKTVMTRFQTEVDYTYDSNDNLAQIQNVGAPGQNVIYTRDGLGRITGVSIQYNTSTGTQTVPLASGITTMPFGPINGMTYGNGLVESRSYDDDYRLTGISIPGVMGLGYIYDPDGNVKSVTDGVNVDGYSFAESLTYDPLNEVTSATGANPFSYGYDVMGTARSGPMAARVR